MFIVFSHKDENHLLEYTFMQDPVCAACNYFTDSSRNVIYKYTTILR